MSRERRWDHPISQRPVTPFGSPSPAFRPPSSRVVEQAQRRIRAAVHARHYAVPQSLHHLLSRSGATPARLRRRPAVPDMDTVHVAPVEPMLDQPLRRRGPPLFTPAPLGLTPLLVRDPSVELAHGGRRLLHDHTSREAQQLQSRGLVAHAFDSTVQGGLRPEHPVENRRAVPRLTARPSLPVGITVPRVSHTADEFVGAGGTEHVQHHTERALRTASLAMSPSAACPASASAQ